MENSMNSINKTLQLSSCSNNDERTADTNCEESGWTMYFEDFFANNNNNDDNIEQNNSLFLDEESSSFVSDAASLVVKKSSGLDNNEQVVGLSTDRSFNKNRLSFKKRRTRAALADDALEDTASSPLNRPEVYDMINQFNKNIKRKENMDISQEKDRCGSSQVDERSDFGDRIGRKSNGTDLKKRGLCLVPLSMVVNYLG